MIRAMGGEAHVAVRTTLYWLCHRHDTGTWVWCGHVKRCVGWIELLGEDKRFFHFRGQFPWKTEHEETGGFYARFLGKVDSSPYCLEIGPLVCTIQYSL